MPASLRVAVTGATGFIGRHLLTRLATGGMAPSMLRRELDPAVDWSDALAGAHAVVHLAAAAHEAAEMFERAGDYAALQRRNALATERLARDAARAGVRHIVFLSTIGVHGEETLGTPFAEDSPLAPRSLYARSKLEAEERLADVARGTGMTLTILRPTLVYGPQNPGNMLRLQRLLDSGWPLPLAHTANRRTLTYVENLADAICAVLARWLPGTFIACDAESVSIGELARTLRAALGRPARLYSLPPAWLRLAAAAAGQGAAARRLLGSLEADGSRLQKALQWHPPFTTVAGLARTGSWLTRGR